MLSKRLLLLFAQLAKMVSLALVALLVFPSAARPHIDSSNDAGYLEGDACAHAGDVLGAVLRRKHDRRDDTAKLPNTTCKGAEGSALCMSHNLVNTGVRIRR